MKYMKGLLIVVALLVFILLTWFVHFFTQRWRAALAVLGLLLLIVVVVLAVNEWNRPSLEIREMRKEREAERKRLKNMSKENRKNHQKQLAAIQKASPRSSFSTRVWRWATGHRFAQ